MRHFLSSIDYPGKDASVVGQPDPLIIGNGRQVIHGAESLIAAAVPPELRKPKPAAQDATA
jgi:polyphosphate kinase